METQVSLTIDSSDWGRSLLSLAVFGALVLLLRPVDLAETASLLITIQL